MLDNPIILPATKNKPKPVMSNSVRLGGYEPDVAQNYIDQMGGPITQRKATASSTRTTSQKRYRPDDNYVVSSKTTADVLDEDEYVPAAKPATRTASQRVVSSTMSSVGTDVMHQPNRQMRRQLQQVPAQHPVSADALGDTLLYWGKFLLKIVASLGLVWWLSLQLWGAFIINIADRWNYGPPRVTVIEGVYGHNDDKEHLTHILARTNRQGKIEIEEKQGGDIAKSKVYAGPDLEASKGWEGDASRAIIDLRNEDIDGDGDLDIVATAQGDTFHGFFERQKLAFYLVNTGKEFKVAVEKPAKAIEKK